MCILPLPPGCGVGDATGFGAVAYYRTVSLNDVRRCPAASMQSQHSLSCPNFRIQHGYELNYHDCAACTNIMKRFPPDQLRQPPLQASLEAGRYYDGPRPNGPNVTRRATNNNNNNSNNNNNNNSNNNNNNNNNKPFIPGLSHWAPTYAEAAALAFQARQDELVQAPDDKPNHALVQVDMANLGGLIRPRQNNEPPRQQTQANFVSPPASPVRPRSALRNRIRPTNEMAAMTQLLEDSLEANTLLTRENEQLKRENENVLRWMAQNGPRQQN